MEALAAQQPGYLGFEGARGSDGLGVSVSYWADEAAAAAWKQVAEHLLVQQQGRTRWYERYTVRVATVTRQYDGPRPRVPVRGIAGGRPRGSKDA